MFHLDIPNDKTNFHVNKDHIVMLGHMVHKCEINHVQNPKVCISIHGHNIPQFFPPTLVINSIFVFFSFFAHAFVMILKIFFRVLKRLIS